MNSFDVFVFKGFTVVLQYNKSLDVFLKRTFLLYICILNIKSIYSIVENIFCSYAFSTSTIRGLHFQRFFISRTFFTRLFSTKVFQKTFLVTNEKNTVSPPNKQTMGFIYKLNKKEEKTIYLELTVSRWRVRFRAHSTIILLLSTFTTFTDTNSRGTSTTFMQSYIIIPHLPHSCTPIAEEHPPHPCNPRWFYQIYHTRVHQQ